jgi:hypothetical protein
LSLKEASRPTRQPTLSRAERLRQKRSEQGQQEQKRLNPSGKIVKPMRKSAIKSASLDKPSSQGKVNSRRTKQRQSPSVLIRGGQQGKPLVNHSRSNVRRKFSIALNNQGAEMLFPTLPFIRPGWRVFSGMLTVVLTVMLLGISSSSDFRIASIQTIGLERTNPADVNAVVKIHDLPIYAVDKKQVEERLLLAFPEFSHVSVKVNFPANIIIEAVERVPVLVWQYSGQLYWVDADGAIFPPRGEEISGSTLKIKSEQPPPPPPSTIPIQEKNIFSSRMVSPTSGIHSNEMDKTLLDAAHRLSELIPPETVLVYSGYDGLGWYDSRGWNVYIGIDLIDLDMKMVVYRALVTQLEQEGITPSMISVEHIHAPFYRLE